MKMTREQKAEQINKLYEKLKRLDERIGRLMSERVTLEDRIAELLDQING